MASPSNSRDKKIIGKAVFEFESGDIAAALTLLVAMEGIHNPNTMFAGLGWDFEKCESLVSNDATLKQALSDCFQEESLDPLREYS
jgi:hypothetical protein